jgi:hypothetical protein
MQIHCVKTEVLASIMSLVIADIERSMRKKCNDGIGGRNQVFICIRLFIMSEECNNKEINELSVNYLSL